MRQYIKYLVLGLMPVFAACACNVSVDELIPYYDRADILYSDSAPWGIIRIYTPTTESILCSFKDYKKTYIDDPDTLRFICDRIKNAADKSDVYRSYCAEMVFLLRNGEQTDTLSCDAYFNPLRFNGISFVDSSLVMCLIDIICDRDKEWQEDKSILYYDNDFHLLPQEMMK